MDKRRQSIYMLCMLLCIVGFFLLSLWFLSLFRPRKLKQTDYEKVRLSLNYNPRALFRFSPDISYMLKPNFKGIRHGSNGFVHRTNSRSLLGEAEVNPLPFITKILFLGDSVAYGEGIPYENNMVYCMQKLAGDKYQLANGSCSGWSTKQEIGFYDKYLSDIDWKAIVIIFCLNDLVNFEWVYYSETILKLSAGLEHIGGLGGFAETVESIKLWNIRKYFDSDPKTLPLSRHDNACLFAWDNAQWNKYFNNTLLPFVEKSDRPMLIIVAIPTLAQMEALKLGASPKIVFYPQHQLRIFCNRFNIIFIDPRHFLLKENIRIDEIFQDMLHLSKKGHEAIANYLWPILEKNLRN